MANANGGGRQAAQALAKAVAGNRMFFPLVCLFLVMLLNLAITPDFFSVGIQNGVLSGYPVTILNRASELVILAVGMTLVVSCSSGTDISVGAAMAFSGAVSIWLLGFGTLKSNNYRIDEYVVPYAFGLMAALAVGVLCGMWNGFLVSKLKIQPMVATLILYTGGRGAAQLFADGQIDRVNVPSFKWLGNFVANAEGKYVCPVPTAIFIAAAVVIATSLVLRRTALGMNIQAVGINGKASRLVGLKSSRIIFGAYVFCGLCAGIAGIIATSRTGTIDANNCGKMIELDAILSVALGGNSLGGGKFSLAGSVIGAITIQALTTSLYAMKVTADQLPVFKALVVIVIVILQSPELRPLVSRARLALAGGKP